MFVCKFGQNLPTYSEDRVKAKRHVDRSKNNMSPTPSVLGTYVQYSRRMTFACHDHALVLYLILQKKKSEEDLVIRLRLVKS